MGGPWSYHSRRFPFILPLQVGSPQPDHRSRQHLLIAAIAGTVLVAAGAWEQGLCTGRDGRQLRSVMEQPLTIPITETDNKLPSKMGRQITSREDIMDRIRATLEANKRAPSFGNQKMSIVGETQSTHLLQARHQRNKTMELSDKACPRLPAVLDVFEYVQCCDDESKMGPVQDVNKTSYDGGGRYCVIYSDRCSRAIGSMRYGFGFNFFSVKYSTNMILMR